MNNKYNDIWDKRYYYADEGGLLGTPRFFIYTPFGHWWRQFSKRWKEIKDREQWSNLGVAVGMSTLISSKINALRDIGYDGLVIIFLNDKKVAEFSRRVRKPLMGLFL